MLNRLMLIFLLVTLTLNCWVSIVLSSSQILSPSPSKFSNQDPSLLAPQTDGTSKNSTTEIIHQRLKRAAVVAATSPIKLIDEPACPEIRTLCNNIHTGHTDDLYVLECVQTLLTSQIEALSDDCQHVIWQHTSDLLDDQNIANRIQRNCTNDLIKLNDNCKITNEPGHYLACIVDHREEITNKICRSLIQRLEWVAFSDFRIIGPFVRDCDFDIDKFACGRLQTDRKPSSTQSETISCLQSHVDLLRKDCKKGVLKLSEIQSDSVKLDRKLFAACAQDARNFCPELRPESGGGVVYKCLIKNKNDNTMSRPCQQQLLRREKLIAHDYKVSKGLARACKEDIKNNHCRRGVSEDKDVRLAQILLCLEAANKNNTKITPDCLIEMNDHRRLLMEDYQLSPEILSGCSDDIQRLCMNMDTGSKTIHCLMEHSRKKKKKLVSATCQRALELLVKVSDVGEDWRVDPVLREACKPVVDLACSDAVNGDSRVMSCLMEKLSTKYMRPECEAALMQIQYFVARDFKLDSQLYRNCKDDAARVCHAKKSWDDNDNASMYPDPGPLVLPCLYRYAYHPDENMKLKPECFKEIKRVMRQRAISVELIPDVEDACLDDLSQLCFDKTEKGEEMQCLQDNLDKLQSECKKVIIEFTEDEAGHVELNPIIMNYCRSAMEKNCDYILRNKDEGNGAGGGGGGGGGDNAANVNGGGDMMECLIAHKNDPELKQDNKCRAAIEHFQLISLKDYHFTYKFKEACRPHVIRFCPKSNTKYDVVACLSEIMRNDTLRGQRHAIPKECRQQIRAQLYQQRENIDFDPKLKSACRNEIKELCDKIPHGSGQVLECLQTNTGHLSPTCRHTLFLIKKSELSDSGTDYTLLTTCRDMLRQYCHETENSKALHCLKTFKDEPLFDKKCHFVIVNRMIEQNMDYRFNPALQEACAANIADYCTPIVATAKQNEELNGKVVNCLKVKFREGKLTKACEIQMTEVLHEQALNYKLNPLLQAVCRDEIKMLCKPNGNDNGGSDGNGAGGGVGNNGGNGVGSDSDTNGGDNGGSSAVRAAGSSEENDDHGSVEECLKLMFLEHRLINKECKYEVALLIQEAKADIHVDPLLQKACTVDLIKYCSHVQSGNGRQLKCLQVVMGDESQAMEPECKSKLEKRIEMFKNADVIAKQAAPENIGELYQQVLSSPSKNYFLIFLLSCLGVIFILGMFCGRATRRTIMMKNK